MREHVESPYGRIWRSAVGVLAALGLIAALVFVSPTANLVAFVFSFLVVGSVCLSVGIARAEPTARVVRSTPRRAAVAGLVVLAICGYAAAVGRDTLVLLGLIVASSPPVLARLVPAASVEPTEPDRSTKPGRSVESAKSAESTHRMRRGRRQAGRSQNHEQFVDLAMPGYLSAVARTLNELSDEEICLAWRRSFLQLQSSATSDRLAAMADVRRAYLDELERRQPEAFSAWIESGPRAAGDPARFFIPHTK